MLIKFVCLLLMAQLVDEKNVGLRVYVHQTSLTAEGSLRLHESH